MNYEAIATWSQVLSSVLFLAVLVWMWVKFIQPAVVTAQEAHNARVREAQRHRDEAKAAVETLHKEIEGARRDAEAIRQRAGEQAARERDEIVAEARSEGERLLQSARGELDRARAAARDQVRGELLEKALALATSDARARIDEAVNAALVDRFVRTVDHDRGTN